MKRGRLGTTVLGCIPVVTVAITEWGAPIADHYRFERADD